MNKDHKALFNKYNPNLQNIFIPYVANQEKEKKSYKEMFAGITWKGVRRKGGGWEDSSNKG